MTARSPEELRAQSFHVLWSLRQLLALAAHLDKLSDHELSELRDPLDAAALEAFCVHARALIEFLWRDRTGRDGKRKPDRSDALAVDWFPNGVWQWMERDRSIPEDLRDVTGRTGWGVAHISYKRLRPEKVAGWDHVRIANRIAYFFACFVDDVDDELVGEGFKDGAVAEVMKWRESRPLELLSPAPNRVATPGNPSSWLLR